MYTDPGILSMIIAAIIGIGLTPLYLFRAKIKEWVKKIRIKRGN